MRLAAIAWLCLVGAATAKVYVHDDTFQPDIVLRANYQDIELNCEKRASVVVNGSYPAPELRLKSGATTWIRVYNDIADHNLTMHWHGLSQRVAPFADGSPQASQWPIPPNHFFDYELHPLPSEAGTYFYHSHIGFQAATCAGPLIVEDKKKPYAYDEERTVFLGDYYNKTDDTIVNGLLANPFVWSGEANSLNVNGLSGTSSVKAKSCAPAVFDVEPGKTYRFRFIGGSAISHISLAAEDHELMIIEADGGLTKPYSTKHLQVASGQRFSVLLKTKSAQELTTIGGQGKQHFWIQFENRDRPPPLLRSYALLSYSKKSRPTIPTSPPLTLPNTTYDFLEYALRPMKDNNFPTASEVTRRVIINATQIIQGSIEWEQNDNIWKESKVDVPYLVDIYKNGEAAIPNYEAAIRNDGWDPDTLAFPAKLGEVLEIVWQNEASPSGGWDFHPFHAHGAHYYDIGSGNGTYDPDANEKRLAAYQPVKRDTTVLYRYAEKGVPGTVAGWRAWRIRVKNPGAWMMHCHILQHIVMGMQTAWVFGNARQIKNRTDPEDIEGFLTFGGSVYGNDTYYPRVPHFFESSGGN